MYTTACQNVVYKQVRVRPLQVWALPLRVYRNHLSDVTSRPRVSACKCNAIDCSKCSSSPAPSLKNGVVQPGREWIALLFFSANRGFDGSLYPRSTTLYFSVWQHPRESNREHCRLSSKESKPFCFLFYYKTCEKRAVFKLQHVSVLRKSHTGLPADEAIQTRTVRSEDACSTFLFQAILSFVVNDAYSFTNLPKATRTALRLKTPPRRHS